MAQYILTAAQKASIDAVLAAAIPFSATGVISGLTNGVSYYGLAADYSGVFSPAAAGYVQRFVDTNGTATLNAALTGSANCVNFSVWMRKNSTEGGSTPRILSASQSINLNTGGSGVLTFQVWNSAGVQIYSAASAPGVINTDTLYHVFASYDGNTGTPIVRVNGALITMTPTVGPTAGALRPARTHNIMHLSNVPSDMNASDFWLEYGATVRDFGIFYNGGTPPDLTGIGAPQIWLGGTMLANERAGNAAQGWNDGFNLGSATITVVSGTFTDVP